MSHTAGPGTAEAERPERYVIDGHVHLYECFDFEGFLRSAFGNLTRLGPGEPAPRRVMLLTEAGSADYFRRLTAGELALPAGYRLEPTDEPVSVDVVREADGARCTLVAGRQIVTREDLEVLSVGSAETIPDGLPIFEVMDRVLAGPGVAGLAWGVGKWLSGRGRTIAQVLKRYAGPRVFVGDNRSRPVFWGRPRLFALADRLGVAVLAGSDPCPFADESALVGTYGFVLDAPADPRRPAEAIRRALASGTRARLVGRRDGVPTFLRRQGRMFLRKHVRRTR